jgi:hypothetical protein
MALKRIVVPAAIKLSVRAAWIVRRAVITVTIARDGHSVQFARLRRTVVIGMESSPEKLAEK